MKGEKHQCGIVIKTLKPKDRGVWQCRMRPIGSYKWIRKQTQLSLPETGFNEASMKSKEWHQFLQYKCFIIIFIF